MTDKDFNEYKYHILKQLDSFQNCREAHSKEFLQIHSEINSMRKEILKEAKEITTAINKLDKRLVYVEVKGGVWGIIGGAISGIAPFVIYYFTKI